VEPYIGRKGLRQYYIFGRTIHLCFVSLLHRVQRWIKLIHDTSPPGTDDFKFTPTATFNDTWTWPDGSWVPAPTQGTPLNSTTSTWVVPTTTIAGTATLDSSILAYYTNCPLTDQHWEDGFDWSLLSRVCGVLLDRYCEPELTGTPLQPTTFPSSCFPPYSDPTDI
jgi:hypothetical protein